MPNTMDRLSSLTVAQTAPKEAIELMRALSAKACTRGSGAAAAEAHYRERWGAITAPPLMTKALEWLEKAAVPPGTTTDATWAAPLMGQLTAGFLALVRVTSVIGKLPVTPVPFNTKLITQSAGASMKWIGENTPKPATALGFGNVVLLPTKAGGILVVSAELMKLSAPGSDQALQQIVSNELTRFVDAAFLSAAPATPANPAGLLNGVTVSASIAATIAAFFTARPNAIAPTWIASPAALGTLSALDPANVPAQFKGYPLVSSPGAGANLILVDAPAIAVADGGLELDISDEALVELNDAPAPPTAGTVYTSLWQANLAGIRVERFINWTAPVGAVQFTATLS